MNSLKLVLILKLAGVIGAIVLLILQTVLTSETISIEKNTTSISAIEEKISKEIADIAELLEKRAK